MTREQQNAGRLLQRAAFVAVALGAAVAKWLLLVDCYCGGLQVVAGCAECSHTHPDWMASPFWLQPTTWPWGAKLALASYG